MAAEQGGGAFATDLGYLDKFFEKLERHASAMTDARAAGRLRGLLAEERARWAEIRALLAGRDPPPAPGARTERAESPGWTVGSLVQR
jgi:hypothetical protein